MIAANELRIGNWVYVQSNKLVKELKPVTPHKIKVVTKQEEHKWHPIPLSPEILVDNCGFQKTHFGNFYRIDNNQNFPWLEDNEDGTFDLTVGDPEYSIGTIRYIHQLQNAYHALTQTELTIDLSPK
jgi:hypothetical protein